MKSLHRHRFDVYFRVNRVLFFFSLQGTTGSSLVAVTCVNKETLTNAENEPQKFDLVRNRMGGWSNFFVAMFPEHKKQHERRVYFGPHKE